MNLHLTNKLKFLYKFRVVRYKHTDAMSFPLGLVVFSRHAARINS